MLVLSAPAEAAKYGDPAVLNQAIQQIESSSGPNVHVPEGPVLHEGDSGETVRTVIRRLQQGGYLSAGFSSSGYGDQVMNAVRQFQEDYGLHVDGLVGPETSRAMNTGLRHRLEEIRRNYQKQQEFFANAPDEPYVLVNIPDAHLVYVDGSRSLEMNVIVGKEGWGTPRMEDTIESIVVNPDWDVPRSIVADDIAPRVARDPGYLDAHHMVVLDGWGSDATRVDPSSIDWSSVTEDNWSHHLKELPGTDNPLGQVKVSFPNDHNIYLHGTPHDQLFERDQRGLSHGCIRMERPIELAGRLLEYGTDDWDTARLRQAARGNDQERIALDRKIPVYLVYWTAFGNSKGELQIRPDLYGLY